MSIFIMESPCWAPETLLVNYTSIKYIYIKKKIKWIISLIPSVNCVIFLCVYMCHIFFILSSGEGHLGFFQILDIVSSVPMNIGVHYLFELVFSFFS